MDYTVSLDLSVTDNILQPLLVASGSSSLNEALACLIETAKTSEGRWSLASKRIIVPVLQLCQFLSCPLRQDILLSSVKLLRNLCAREIKNQNLFMGLGSGSDNGLLRMLLQVLGNVSLAGEEHQLVVWRQFFPLEFLEIARVQSKETCDPLCMVIYTCSGSSNGLHAELCADSGLEILIEIMRTVTVASGFREDWLKLLLSRICHEEYCFSSVFSKLFPMVFAYNYEDTLSKINDFGDEQEFLLSILSEALNEQVGNIVILRNAVEVVDFTTRGKSNLPTVSADIDVMGYSLTILRDVCACDDAADMLVSAGLIELLLTLLRELEPPIIIRKAMAHSEAKDGTTSHVSKYCPYTELDGLILLLQQCIIDEDNPFSREGGIWVVHNLLEGNEENVKLVANLELRGTVDVPELAQMGLLVEVDPKTRRAKLVNAP
ncbi:hypothetical protein ACJIZ3_018412 [Penstemon smallii]|uniref:Ataxin-10 domain-containing protein n=1 Tax=Penstemon smallii TaxID=265156 RepID=A0ABD3SYD8_9LAMI